MIMTISDTIIIIISICLLTTNPHILAFTGANAGSPAPPNANLALFTGESGTDILERKIREKVEWYCCCYCCCFFLVVVVVDFAVVVAILLLYFTWYKVLAIHI